MKDLLKRTKTNMILMTLIAAVLGLVLILWPASATVFICLCAGWLTLFGGICLLIIHFASQNKENNTKMLLGVIGFALGLWIVLRPILMVQFVSMLFGVILMLRGSTGLEDSFTMKRSGFQNWWIFTILAAVTILLAIFVIWAPVGAIAVTIVTGVALLFDSISGLVSGLRVLNLDKEEVTTINF